MPTSTSAILGPARKAAERDLAVAVAQRWEFGATTVSASVALAAAAGIAVFATGGIGGVHRGAEVTGDVSADLDAIAHHPVVTVCAGAKAFLDLPRTLEHLETAGVPVLGWRHDWFPAFYTRSSGCPCRTRSSPPARSPPCWPTAADPTAGVLLTVPIPEADELDAAELDAALAGALADADGRDRRRRRHAVRARPHRRGHGGPQRPGQPRPRRAQRRRRRRRRSPRFGPVGAGRLQHSDGATLGWISGCAEELAVAQDGDGAVLADDDDGGLRVVEAVAATRRVAHAAETATPASASALGTSRTPSWRRMPRVEHGRAVDLGEGVAQRRQVGRPA